MWLVVEGGHADVDAGRLAVGCPPLGQDPRHDA
nr:MAG TPA: hypothetical protein [Caudoviricetes sp.]